MASKDKDKTSEVPILLVAAAGDSRWDVILDQAGIRFDRMEPGPMLRSRLVMSPPIVLLLDMAHLDEALPILKRTVLQAGVRVTAVIGLVGKHSEDTTHKLVDRVFENGFQEFIPVDIPAGLIERRIRFIYREAVRTQSSDHSAESLMDHVRSGDAIWVLDVESDMVAVSGPLRALLGSGLEARLVARREFVALFPSADRMVLGREIDRAREWGEAGVVRLRRAGLGGGEPFQCVIEPFRRGEEVVRVEGVVRPLSQRGYGHDWLFTTDPLTGFQTRDGFVSLLDVALADDRERQLEESGPGHFLLLVELERFREIQAAYPANEVDLAIQEVALRLRAAVDDFLGGNVDERQNQGQRASFGYIDFSTFAVSVLRLGSIQTAARLAQKLRDCFTTALSHKEDGIFVAARVSIAEAGGDILDGSALLQRGRLVLRASDPTDGLAVYAPMSGVSPREKFDVENQLRRALVQDDLELYYQPQVDIASGKVEGFEALLRWDHPVFGLMTPDSFLSLAEGAGLLDGIAGWVFERAIIDTEVWAKLGYEDLNFSVNVSAALFANNRIVDRLIGLIRAGRLIARNLTVEVTEDSVMRNPERVAGTIRRLKRRGVRFALDDFGTGYSALAHLSTLPFDELKIDRLFVKDLDVEGAELAVVKAIIDMADALGMTVLAEGVETVKQLEILMHAGCHKYQGFLCSTPIRADDVPEFLEARARQAEGQLSGNGNGESA